MHNTTYVHWHINTPMTEIYYLHADALPVDPTHTRKKHHQKFVGHTLGYQGEGPGHTERMQQCLDRTAQEDKDGSGSSGIGTRSH